jgi:cytidylate kinase
MTVVTISRHFGAGGHTLGEELSERFGFRLVDEAVVDQLAHKEKISPRWLHAMEKEASSTLLSMLSNFVSNGLFYKQAGVSAEKVERQKYIAFLAQIFADMAKEGGYVIVGRGAQFILRGHPNVMHVLLVADNRSRIEFLVGHHKISRSEAVKKIRTKERERAAVASRLFKSCIDDLGLYHIVLNTGLMPYEWAVESVCQVVNRFIERESKLAV